jgi:hypothetical protein
LAAWIVATVAVALPILLYLRHLDDLAEPVDEVEVTAARRRHPSRPRRAA